MFAFKDIRNDHRPMRTPFFLVFVVLLLCEHSAVAQMFGRRGPKGTPPPKALLVTILTRQKQREHLKAYRPDLLREFERDVKEVAKRTVKDFSENFRYCPVYFFADSNANKIVSGEWDGVLLDSALRPAANPVIRPGDKDFFIAHYGSPIPQPDSVKSRTPGDMGSEVEDYGDDPSALFREKLIVTDADFKILSVRRGPRTNYVRSLRPSGMSHAEYRVYRRALTYNSKRWYVDYMPTAYSYDASLRKFYR